VYQGPGGKSWEEVPKPVVIDHPDPDARRHPPDRIRSWRPQRQGPSGRCRRHRRRRPDRSLGDDGRRRLYSPSHVVAIDLADTRLEAAKQFGADIVVNNSREDALAVIQELTGGLGADVAIEAVGTPATFELATRLARPGGHIANIGVHGQPATLHLEDLWIRNVTITTGRVDTSSTPPLLRLAQGHQIDADRFVTHHFSLDQFEEAYDVFSRAANTGALKVVLTRI
jgi:alcohol dehydrogenase